MGTRKIRYVGVHDGVDVPLIRQTVMRGEIAEVDDAHAELLLQQAENWQDASERKASADQDEKRRGETEQTLQAAPAEPATLDPLDGPAIVETISGETPPVDEHAATTTNEGEDA